MLSRYAFVLAECVCKTATNEWMNEWQLVELTNHESITFESTKNTFYSRTILMFNWFYWTRAYQSELECIRSELWFTLFFLLIQHSTNNNKIGELIIYCYHNSCYFYALWIIVELFALFHTFAEVNEPMQLYRQSLSVRTQKRNNSQISVFPVHRVFY